MKRKRRSGRSGARRWRRKRDSGGGEGEGAAASPPVRSEARLPPRLLRSRLRRKTRRREGGQKPSRAVFSLQHTCRLPSDRPSSSPSLQALQHPPLPLGRHLVRFPGLPHRRDGRTDAPSALQPSPDATNADSRRLRCRMKMIRAEGDATLTMMQRRRTKGLDGY